MLRSASNAPERFEPGRGQLGVAHRVLDVLVAQIRLKGAGIMSLGSERKSASMPQHVRMRLEAEPCLCARTLDHPGEACGGEGGAALRREHKGRLRLLLPLQPSKHAKLVPDDRVGAGAALLDPANVQGGRSEVHLIPPKVCQLACPQAMTVGNKDHGGVPMSPAVAPGGPEQPFDLGLRQVFASAQVGIWGSLRCNCSIYGARSHQPET